MNPPEAIDSARRENPRADKPEPLHNSPMPPRCAMDQLQGYTAVTFRLEGNTVDFVGTVPTN